MSVVILDGGSVREFVANDEAFNKTMQSKFHELDVNGDGVLSRSELRKACESLSLGLGLLESAQPEERLNAFYDSIFEGFDTDHNNTVDPAEFQAEMKNIFTAIADGLGTAPIQVVLDQSSMLKEAAEFQSSKPTAN